MVIIRFAEHVPAPETRIAEKYIDTKEIKRWLNEEIFFGMDSYAESRNFKCRTLSFSTFGIINSDPRSRMTCMTTTMTVTSSWHWKVHRPAALGGRNKTLRHRRSHSGRG